ncbi:hypothetical protein V475_10915 [Sphingobium baderi LL03]|nr:hypothetical protein V475_10915 [Sphingobium baderi LL03]
MVAMVLALSRGSGAVKCKAAWLDTAFKCR